MIQWQHKFVAATWMTEAEINRLGRDGWGLAAVADAHQNNVYIFRRHKMVADVDDPFSIGKLLTKLADMVIRPCTDECWTRNPGRKPGACPHEEARTAIRVVNNALAELKR